MDGDRNFRADGVFGRCLCGSSVETAYLLQIYETRVPFNQQNPATLRRTVTVSLAGREATMKTSPYSWESAFLSALSDLQSPQLPARIAAARALIDARVQELLTLEHRDKERVALIDALFALHCVEQYGNARPVKDVRLQAS